ncbi:phage baseplate protein [Elizabethkingia anophelis]|uniref:phage baseplate protein n=1 Tax=Elizabethkingia anophelis TaxID=1117645 RepID=UPI0021A85D12|nr:hypothetical protein [Elizabethkingia anophelis]
MKTFNYNQTGGFKVTTETLSDIQSAYSIVEGVARMAGDKSIISGCEEANGGVTVGDGVVMINKELLAFKGGVKGNTVIIREIITQKKFENGEVKDVIKDRFATFGYSNEFYIWADFKRVTNLSRIEERLAKLEKAAKPIIDGNAPVLFMRPVNEIPAGWEEVTDFRGRMPVGWNPDDGNFNTIGETGGNKTHKITISELPAHSFKIFGGVGADTPTINNSPESSAAFKGDSPNDNEDWNYTITSNNGQAMYGKTNTVGQDQDMDIMNPYRIVMYIRFKG